MIRMPAARVRASLALTVGTFMALTACARPGPTTGAAPDPEAGLAMLSSNHGCPTPDHATLLPADAVLVSVDRCRTQVRDIAGDGQWDFQIDERATTNLAPLAAALRRPSEPIDAQGLCDAMLHAQPDFTVTDQLGRRITPTVPQTACHAPLPVVVQTLNDLVWTPITATKLGQIQTQLGATSGCSDRYKQMIAFTAENGRSGAPEVAPVGITADTLRVCRYDLDPSPNSGLPDNHGGVIHGGRLVATSTLDNAAAHALLAALNAAHPATGACSHQESPFAVVSAADSGLFIMIELSGCYRALVDDENYLRQLDAATVNRLLPP